MSKGILKEAISKVGLESRIRTMARLYCENTFAETEREDLEFEKLNKMLMYQVKRWKLDKNIKEQ